jgi:hypothetical protein
MIPLAAMMFCLPDRRLAQLNLHNNIMPPRLAGPAASR